MQIIWQWVLSLLSLNTQVIFINTTSYPNTIAQSLLSRNWTLSPYKLSLRTGPSTVSQSFGTPRHFSGANIKESLFESMGSFLYLPPGNIRYFPIIANHNLIHYPVRDVLRNETPFTKYCPHMSALGHPHRLVGMPDPTATLATCKMVESVGKDRVSMPDRKPVH